MFDDDDTNESGEYRLSSITAIRDAALIMYGRFLADAYKRTPDDETAKKAAHHLSLQETESIVREHSDAGEEDGLYVFGGDTKEEARKKINELLAALMDRIMSNVLAAGVRQELIDCSYNTDTNDFEFSVTEKGKQVVDHLRKNKPDVD